MTVQHVPNGLYNLLPDAPAVAGPDLAGDFQTPTPADQDQLYGGFAWSASGGLSPYIWSGTNVPAGMNVTSSASQGLLQGTPTGSGSVVIHLTVTDALGATSSGDVTLTIAPAVVGGARTLINPSLHFVYKGGLRIAKNIPAGAGGTQAGSGCAMTVRYVGGQRRILVANFAAFLVKKPFSDLGPDMVEYILPYSADGSAYYQAANSGAWASAPALVETRRWQRWTAVPENPTWADAGGGLRCGGIWWDEARGLLWYTLYGYYDTGQARALPVLGATQLTDTVVSGTFRAVGTKYGPWYYVNNQIGANSPMWKLVNHNLQPVPSYAQAGLGGKTFLMGSMTGAVTGPGDLGPGLTAKNLPPLTDPPLTIMPAGTRLMDFSPQGGAAVGIDDNRCRRINDASSGINAAVDTRCIALTKGGLTPGGLLPGGWQMTNDMGQAVVWIDTGTKHGFVVFGRQSYHDCWYGYNPEIYQYHTDPIADPAYLNGISEADYNSGSFSSNSVDTDPSATWTTPLPYTDATQPGTVADLNTASGYRSIGWRGMILVFDPDHLAQVAAGTRRATSDGMVPQYNADWKALWPQIPGWQNGAERTTTSQNSNAGCWDNDPANGSHGEFIYVQGASVFVGALWLPTVHMFKVI